MKNISDPIFSRQAVTDVLNIMKNSPWTEDLMNELLNLWELCVEDDERLLLKELISEMFILDTKKQRTACKGINTYLSSLKVAPQNSHIVAVADVGKNDGSSVGLKSLQQIISPTDIWESKFVSHIPDLPVKVKTGDTIIVFDDFIGSGKKILRKIGWLSKELAKRSLDIKDFKIIIITFSAMSFGLKKIKDELGITPFSYNTFSKAITEKNSPIDANIKKNIMLNIESKLAKKYKNRNLADYSLGFGGSESLYYWEMYSCPNNVFPIFWWPEIKNGSSHKTLLTRTN